MNDERWPKFKSPARKECPVCRRFMVADDIMHNPPHVWRCLNPDCPERPLFLRYTSYVAVPRDRAGYGFVESFAEGAPGYYRELHCCLCDHLVELVDSVYNIWCCPNCRIIRRGVPNFIDYDESGAEVDRTYHLIAELNFCTDGTYRTDSTDKPDDV